MQINGQMHDQKKLQTRYDRLEGQIRSFMPDEDEGEGAAGDKKKLQTRQNRQEGQIKGNVQDAGEVEGAGDKKVEKKDIIFLPDQWRRYNVKSQNSMFEFEKVIRKPKSFVEEEKPPVQPTKSK